MSDWFCDHDTLWGFAWTQINERQDTRLWAMATVTENGVPSVRTVVARAADLERHAVQFHTDLGSAKVQDLGHNASVSLMCWLPTFNLQIRLQAHVSVLTGAAVSGVWADVPDPSRKSYGTRPVPGTRVASALDYEKPADPNGFAVLDCTVNMVDLLHLGTDHRRAVYARNSDWIGQWVAP